MMETLLTPAKLETALSYEQYRALIDRLLEDEKTTGPDHSPTKIDYTKLNVHRMNRLDRTTVLNDDLRQTLLQLSESYTWLVLTEAWCGDAAQVIPVFYKIAESSPHITLKLLLRDENLDLMDQFLTNGGRSIPKLICLRDSDGAVVATWGPKPAPAQEMLREFKAHGDGDYKAFSERLHGWYAKDRTQTTQQELLELVKALSA
ncbi:Thioredoxin [Catalinimonas alkaloidigena]|uniref:Thioredoxin n=1 Tax=Catalinimonas alkaloidigena TaxID=1075417 RepID=A0A1G9PR35_9BACT|nr:thioredoxin family protein [Catalinimonas alkaloidigena]SDM00565.1 Thioredoxin [Catalinimonas alkaloidigena]